MGNEGAMEKFVGLQLPSVRAGGCNPLEKKQMGLGFFIRVLCYIFFLGLSIVIVTSLFIEVFRGKNSKSALSLRACLNSVLHFQFVRFDLH